MNRKGRPGPATIVLLAIVLAGTSVLAAPQHGAKTTVAVSGFGLKSDFEAAYGSSAASGGMAAILAAELEKTNRFLVVERPGLGKVLAEQELTAAGLVRREGAARPGELLAAKLLVHGEVTEFMQSESGDSGSIGIGNSDSNGLGIGVAPNSRTGTVAIDVRVVDSTSGRVVSTFTVREKVKTQSVAVRLAFRDMSVAQQSYSDTALGKAARKAMAQIAGRLVESSGETPWSGRVIDIEAREVAINAGSDAGIEVGERYRIFRVTKVLRDPATGRVLGDRRQRVGELTIIDVGDEIAFGRLEPGESDLPRNNDLVTL